MSLARAREKLIDAKRMVLEGRSPAQERQHEIAAMRLKADIRWPTKLRTNLFRDSDDDMA